MARVQANGWQPEAHVTHGDVVRSGAGRPVLRPIDGGRSGAPEQEVASIPSWRRSVSTDLRDHPGGQSRHAEGPHFPVNGQPVAYREAEQAGQGPWIPRQPTGPRAPLGPDPAPQSAEPGPPPAAEAGTLPQGALPATSHGAGPRPPDELEAPFDRYRPPSLLPPSFDDLPALARVTAANRAAQGSHAADPSVLSGDAEGGATDPGPERPTGPEIHGTATDPDRLGQPSVARNPRFGPAEVLRPADLLRGGEPPIRPADQLRPGGHRPVETQPPADGARQSAPYLDRQPDGYGPPMAPREPARRTEPAGGTGRGEPSGDAAAFRSAPQPPASDPPNREGTGSYPGPWEPELPAEALRQAAPLRDSLAAIRAAAVAVAAAEAHAEAEDHAAVQAAYSAAVDAGRAEAGTMDEIGPRPAPREPSGGPEEFDPQPLGPPTPLGQPSLADYADRSGTRQSGSAGGPGFPTSGGPSGAVTAFPTSGGPAGAEGPAQAGPLPIPRVLPQRVPAAPDVPEVPDDGPDDDFVEPGRGPTFLDPPELARIATHLRYDEDLEEAPPQRPDGFDTDAVLAAVRDVPGVRDAQLKPNPGGVHTLRLDLADGADGALVSRLVARLLKQRMGLAAEPRRQPSEPRRQAEPRQRSESRQQSEPRQPSQARQQPAAGQQHRDASSMPVAGTVPTPRTPLPAGAAEHLGGAAARNESARRRHQMVAGRGRGSAEADPEPRRVVRSVSGPRVVIDQVQVSTLGLDATVEVRLNSGGRPAIGVSSGPAVDGYVLRMAAVAAAAALDQLLSTMEHQDQPGRCFVEHAAVVPFGGSDVAVVVVLLVLGGTAEQLSGSALVAGDPRQAIVRATLAAVNRRLDALLG